MNFNNRKTISPNTVRICSARLFLASFLFLTFLHSLEQPCTQTNLSNEPYEILAPQFLGFIIKGAHSSSSYLETDSLPGIKIIDLKVPTKERSLSDLLETYLGKPVTIYQINEIKREIINFYRKNNHPIVYVEVPPQLISSGVLELIVYEGKLGKIQSTGNKYFKSDRLLGYIRNSKNEPVNMDQLIEDLEWMNRNPFRQTNSIFSPSGQNGMTDIELVTKDRFPWRFYAGVDNTGIPQIGRTRYYAGFNWGDAFFLDHMLSCQFTSASNINHYWSISLDYLAPLPWRHSLVIFGGYSHVKAPLETLSIGTQGYSAQASFRYEIPMHPFINFLEDFLFGFDWKRTNTSIDQEGDLFFEQSVNLTQLVMGYNGGYEKKWCKLSGTIEVYGSPGQWLPDQSRKRYEELRLGANNRYIYSRIAYSSIFTLKHQISIHNKLRGQVSSTNLLASEQFGLGGWDTVRGYQVREVNVDNVFICNIELRSPPIKIFSHLKPSLQDELTFLVFMDYAYGSNHKNYPGDVKHNNLMGVGSGLRYNFLPYLSFRGDLGYKVWQPPQSDNTARWRFEFGCVASY